MENITRYHEILHQEELVRGAVKGEGKSNQNAKIE
jgi:hypothetical protein